MEVMVPPVIFPPVKVVIFAVEAKRFVIAPVTARKTDENRLVAVALVNRLFCAKKLVADADVVTLDEATSEEINPCSAVKFEIVPDATVRSLIVEVARLVIPFTYKLDPTVCPPVVEALLAVR